MKKIFKTFFACSLLLIPTLFTSCDTEGNEILRQNPDDAQIIISDETEFDLKVNPENANQKEERNIIVSIPAGEEITVNANFKGNENMYRLYMTRYFIGNSKGVQPFEYPLGEKKSDGSIDLQQDDKKEFTYTFNFKASETIGEVVQYVLWVTNGRGDFRDVSKRNAIDKTAIGVITIKAQDKNTPAETDQIDSNEVYGSLREFSAILLAAPLADGSSESFISVFNGKKYKIAQQEAKQVTYTNESTFSESEKAENAQLASLWDFGYYYTGEATKGTGKANFASANEYMNAFQVNKKAVINITHLTGLSKTELNPFYFVKSSKIFQEIQTVEQLLENLESSDQQTIKNLVIGDVIAFQDAYGNRGLIRIKDLNPGYKSENYIKIDVKVQVKAQPLKG